MKYELHKDAASIENLPLREMAEAFLQPRLQRDQLEESLN
jgi:hypothetical protein